MGPDPGRADAEASSPAHSAAAETQLGNQVMLAEYSALRAEADRRANVQWNVLALQITSAGVISSLAISRIADIGLLLVIPLSSYMLGSRYILHDYHIKLISRYIRNSLSGRLQGYLAWENWKISQMQPDVQRGHQRGEYLIPRTSIIASHIRTLLPHKTRCPRSRIIAAPAQHPQSN